MYRSRIRFCSCCGYDAAGTTINLKFGSPSRVRSLSGTVTSPAVMLSPNARNFVLVSRGAIVKVTLTLNVHAADCPAASLAVHWTVVVPWVKSEPD